MRGVTEFTKMVSLELEISTHTPHARRDSTTATHVDVSTAFQLTRLMRGVTP